MAASVLPTTADVIVLGGGPAGTAAAWALARLSPGIRIVLLEAGETLGAGSTLASLECFRSCWPAEPLAEMMRRSIQVFLHADHYLGEGAQAALSVKQNGYLFCAFSEHYANQLRADVARLHQIGLPHIEYLTGDEARTRFPHIGAKVVAAKFDPLAGWLDSNALIHAFARASGAQIFSGVEAVRLCLDGSRVTGVATAQGTVSAPNVLLAAGAWSVQIARDAGLPLPVQLYPRQSVTTGWRHDPFPPDSPMLIGAPPAPHVRPEAGSGAIFGWEYRWRAKDAAEAETMNPPAALLAPVPNLTRLKDPRFPALTMALLARQFGHRAGEGFNNPRYLHGLHHNIGYYVARDAATAYRTLPDGTRQPYESERAIIDAHPDVEGLFLSIAHVGHGIMTAPSAGEIAACKILRQAPPHPALSAFDLAVPYVEYDTPVL